jgi:hypothetical protein
MHQGHPMTVATALPILIKLARKRHTLRAVLGCRDQPRYHKPAVQDVPDLDWSHCPLDLMDDPHITAVHHLARCAAVAPLSGWPAGYAAWAVAGLMAIDGAG